MFKLLSSILGLLSLFMQLHSSNGQLVTVRILPRLPGVSVTEGEEFQACFTLLATPPPDYVLSIVDNTQNGVLGPFDGTLTFNEAIPMVEKCITITLETNNEFGPQTIVSDVFEITITFGDQTMVELSGQFLIVDATVLNVGFQQNSYTFIEGTSGEVCVTVDGFIAAGLPDFRADISYSPGTAEPVTDYTEGVTGVLFGPSTENQMQCLTININDDEVFEPTETFTVSISSTESPLAINQLLSVATVTIFDSDANCGNYPSREGLTAITSGDFTMDSSGDVVSNQGATATYSCMDTTLMLTGNSELTCSITGMWEPEPPTCEEEEEEESPTSIPTQPPSVRVPITTERDMSTSGAMPTCVTMLHSITIASLCLLFSVLYLS